MAIECELVVRSNSTMRRRVYVHYRKARRQTHSFLCLCSQVWFKINVGTMKVRVGLPVYPGLAFVFDGAPYIVSLFSVLIEYAAYSAVCIYAFFRESFTA